MGRVSNYIEAAENLETARTNLMESIRPIGVPELSDVADVYTRASTLSVLSDIRFREAERRELFKPRGEHTGQLRRSANLQNEACLELLGEPAHLAVSHLQTRFEGTPIAGDSLDFFRGQIQEALIENDFKAADLGKFLEQEDKTFSIARESGVDGVCSELLRGGDHLIALRKRRAEHNDPVTTVIGGLIVLAGALTLGICAAVSGGSCRNDTALFVGWALIGLGVAYAVFGNIALATA